MIINLILLTSAYFYCSYSLVEKMIHDTRSGITVVILILLLFMTLGIIGIYFVVLKRHTRSIVLLGTILLLMGFFSTFRPGSLCLITGILFIIWSIILSNEDRNIPENNSIKDTNKYKYWLYSASIFCISGILIGIWGMGNWSISLKDTMLLIMLSLLLTGILQLIIYFVMSKMRDRRNNKMNSVEKN